MAPDWAYACNGTVLAFDGHSVVGVLAFCVPVAVVAGMILRRVSPVLFAYVPSPSELPVRQLRVLALRRPPLLTTVASALVGALTHVGWDLFTHDDRWGPRHVSWLRSEALTLLGRDLSWAKVLQYASHVLGAVLALYLLARILTSGSLRRWYGLGPGDSADADPPAGTVRFWAVTILGVIAGVAWAALGHPGIAGQLIRASVGLGAGLVAASVVCARLVGLPAEVPGR